MGEVPLTVQRPGAVPPTGLDPGSPAIQSKRKELPSEATTQSVTPRLSLNASRTSPRLSSVLQVRTDLLSLRTVPNSSPQSSQIIPVDPTPKRDSLQLPGIAFPRAVPSSNPPIESATQEKAVTLHSPEGNRPSPPKKTTSVLNPLLHRMIDTSRGPSSPEASLAPPSTVLLSTVPLRVPQPITAQSIHYERSLSPQPWRPRCQIFPKQSPAVTPRRQKNESSFGETPQGQRLLIPASPAPAPPPRSRSPPNLLMHRVQLPRRGAPRAACPF